jgi:hypothetical protein
MNLDNRKIALLVGIISVLFILLTPISQIGAWEEPPSTGTIQPPEIWGVVVLKCTGGTADGTLRVKKVDGCEVQTDAEVLYGYTVPNCSTLDANGPLYHQFSGISLFEGIEGTPIITKVKNFINKEEDGVVVVSFDAQIKFCVGCPSN